MRRYKFVTHWLLNAAIDRVWHEIRDMDSWPEWWKYVKSVQLISDGYENEPGGVRRIVWKTALPYDLTFDSVLVSIDHHKRIEGKAFGELTGIGIWTFESTDEHTIVRYDWKVTTHKWWMNLVSPIARPVFKWNHDKVMHAGYEGIKQRLAMRMAPPDTRSSV